jgi:glycerophosphoryl diester phosphodiesterase
MNKILKIGHRGAKGYIAENTLASFQKAIHLGCDGIELDVHLSLDGEIIVIHDDTIDRTTTGKGFVNKLTLAELKLHNIPTLAEVLEIANRNLLINIELKSYETVEKVIDLIEKNVHEKNRIYTDFIVSSFDWQALQQLRFLNEKIQIGVLTEDNLETAFAFAKFIKATTLNPYFKLLNEENVAKIHEKEIKIYVWTVNEIEDIKNMKNLKVDGIISDFPDRI